MYIPVRERTQPSLYKCSTNLILHSNIFRIILLVRFNRIFFIPNKLYSWIKKTHPIPLNLGYNLMIFVILFDWYKSFLSFPLSTTDVIEEEFYTNS